MPVQVVLELRKDSITRDPSVQMLNLFLPARYASLSLVGSKARQHFTIQPFDPSGGMMAFDDGQAMVSLSKREIPSIETSFPLVTVYHQLVPGLYDCQVSYSVPTNRSSSLPDKQESRGGVWGGTIQSGSFRLEVRPEVPKTKSILVPRQLRLSKEIRAVREGPDAPLVAVPVYFFEPSDADEVQVRVRNGHFIGTRCTEPDGESLSGGPPEPSDDEPCLAWYDYAGGDKHVEFNMVVFETTVVPQHLWSPGPGTPGYRVLWAHTFRLSFSEDEFRRLPARHRTSGPPKPRTDAPPGTPRRPSLTG